MTQFILVYSHPTEGEQRFDLVPNRSYRIGSRPDNDIVIDQKDVSRRHAVLRVQDGSFHITDLDSKNGTFINGAKTVSETFNCGDMVHLSSARLVIVELGTGSYPTRPEAIVSLDDDSAAEGREETQNYRGEASMEDVISLLETTASAVRRGALADPLKWSVDHLGFDGAVVLYRDENDRVAMVSSAGELGQLARNSAVLTRLATGRTRSMASGIRVRQVTELGENLLVATVGADHVLVVRFTGQPPAIGDLRSLIAAVSAVLGSGNIGGRGSAPASPGSEKPPTTAGGRPAPAAGPSADNAGAEGHVGVDPADSSDVREAAAAAVKTPVPDFEGLAALELAEARNVFEEWIVKNALEASRGNQTEAAKRLGLSRAGLFKKMRKLGL
jgi:DNA-binding protein Fis